MFDNFSFPPTLVPQKKGEDFVFERDMTFGKRIAIKTPGVAPEDIEIALYGSTIEIRGKTKVDALGKTFAVEISYLLVNSLSVSITKMEYSCKDGLTFIDLYTTPIANRYVAATRKKE